MRSADDNRLLGLNDRMPSPSPKNNMEPVAYGDGEDDMESSTFDPRKMIDLWKNL